MWDAQGDQLKKVRDHSLLKRPFEVSIGWFIIWRWSNMTLERPNISKSSVRTVVYSSVASVFWHWHHNTSLKYAAYHVYLYKRNYACCLFTLHNTWRYTTHVLFLLIMVYLPLIPLSDTMRRTRNSMLSIKKLWKSTIPSSLPPRNYPPFNKALIPQLLPKIQPPGLLLDLQWVPPLFLWGRTS